DVVGSACRPVGRWRTRSRPRRTAGAQLCLVCRCPWRVDRTKIDDRKRSRNRLGGGHGVGLVIPSWGPSLNARSCKLLIAHGIVLYKCDEHFAWLFSAEKTGYKQRGGMRRRTES